MKISFSILIIVRNISKFGIILLKISKFFKYLYPRYAIFTTLYQAGVENVPTCFLFSDTQVVEERFLEDINNILSSGMVPNLYSPEDVEDVVSNLSDAAKKAGITQTSADVFRFFIDRVRANLHVILCMSPIGEAFRNRIRQYPAFVNCTTIDWFTEWPKVTFILGQNFKGKVSK